MVITALRRFLCGRGRQHPVKSPDGFARDEKGSAAVEFALTAPIFFATLLSIFEFAMLFGTNVMVETATNRAARAVRTGQVYEMELFAYPGMTFANEEAAFEFVLCDGLLFLNCNELSYDIQVHDDFTVANANVSCGTDGRIQTPVFDIGEPAEVVVLTVLHPYQPILPNPMANAGQNWQSAGNCNGFSMKSVLVFVNEPFPRAVP